MQRATRLFRLSSVRCVPAFGASIFWGGVVTVTSRPQRVGARALPPSSPYRLLQRLFLLSPTNCWVTYSIPMHPFFFQPPKPHHRASLPDSFSPCRAAAFVDLEQHAPSARPSPTATSLVLRAVRRWPREKEREGDRERERERESTHLAILPPCCCRSLPACLAPR